MKCLIVGASGFIGSNLSPWLSDRGIKVSGYGRSTPSNHLRGISWTLGDLADTVTLRSAVRGHEVVVHLASTTLPNSSNNGPIAAVEANVIPAIRLFDVCVEEGVRKIIFASSGGTVYGNAPDDQMNENIVGWPISSYGITKMTIERYLYLYKHMHGLDYTTLRISNPYGPFQSPGRGQGVIAAFMQRILRGSPVEVWGDGSIVRDYIYIDDVCSAFEACLGNKGSGAVFNVASGKGKSTRELLNLIVGTLQVEKVNVIYKDAKSADVLSNILDIEHISRALDWRPIIGLEEGLSRTADWIRRLTCC